jgi:hypothetical protein
MLVAAMMVRMIRTMKCEAGFVDDNEVGLVEGRS